MSTTTEVEHVTESDTRESDTRDSEDDGPESTLPSGGDHTLLFPISSVPTTVTSTGTDIGSITSDVITTVTSTSTDTGSVVSDVTPVTVTDATPTITSAPSVLTTRVYTGSTRALMSTGSTHPPPRPDPDHSVSPEIPGTTDVMQSVTQLLEAQRMMMAAQVQAMAAQTVPPLNKFTGEDVHSEDSSFERWIEGFEERAKAMGWNKEQRLFQLRAHLDKTAEHAVRMLSETEKCSYESTVAALRKRFLSLDIEELRGLEFHQLMQTKQSVEEMGICLQKLAKKAFPGSTPKEFDRLLKGRFYQALLPKWQRKLGAPKATETFDDLYARARALERHDQQFNVRAIATINLRLRPPIRLSLSRKGLSFTPIEVQDEVLDRTTQKEENAGTVMDTDTSRETALNEVRSLLEGHLRYPVLPQRCPFNN